MYLNPDSEPIVTGHQFRSPKLAIDQLSESQQSRLHEVKVSARVVADPTMSSINSAALISGMSGSNNQTIPVPPPGDDLIDISSQYDLNSSGNKRVFSEAGSITQAIHKRFSGPSFDLAPPYKVVSSPKTYLVSKKPAGQPCFFKFPVENGYFIIANLRNLKKSGNSYSGDGSLIFNLPDSSVSVKEHFVPIAFSGWQINGDVVQSGTIDTPTDTQLDNLPGLKAHLGHLAGIAGVKLDATLDVEMHDPTLYQAYSQSASGQKWPGLTAPLSPEGDWYSPPQHLNLTRIGWSLVNIEAADNVRIDLSHNEGTSACNTYNPINPSGWVGIHFGPDAVVYPYTFNLVNTLSIPAPGWGVVSNGICGTAKTTPDQKVESSFGKAGGKIRWNSIEIAAHAGDVTSTYEKLQVDMTWPQVSLVGNAILEYTGQTVDPQLLLEP